MEAPIQKNIALTNTCVHIKGVENVNRRVILQWLRNMNCTIYEQTLNVKKQNFTLFNATIVSRI